MHQMMNCGLIMKEVFNMKTLISAIVLMFILIIGEGQAGIVKGGQNIEDDGDKKKQEVIKDQIVKTIIDEECIVYDVTYGANVAKRITNKNKGKLIEVIVKSQPDKLGLNIDPNGIVILPSRSFIFIKKEKLKDGGYKYEDNFGSCNIYADIEVAEVKVKGIGRVVLKNIMFAGDLFEGKEE